MGGITCCQKQKLNYSEKLEELKFNESKYSNEIFPFCKILEETTNLFKYIPLQSFLYNLNSFSYEEENSDKIHFKEIKKSLKSYKSEEKKINSARYKNNSMLNDTLSEIEFQIFLEKNLLKNSIGKNHIFSDEINLYIFQKLLKEIFLKFQKFLFKKKEKNYKNIPKFIISSIGFNFCECAISQKINALTQLLQDDKGLITQKNSNVNSFLYCYFINVIEVPALNLLNLIEKNQFVKENNFIEILGSRNFNFLKENFLIKNNQNDEDCLFFTNKAEIFTSFTEEINVTDIFDQFMKTVLKSLFGSNGKKEMSADDLKDFLIDDSEFGGFWILFNESIRRKFEVFLDAQTK